MKIELTFKEGDWNPDENTKKEMQESLAKAVEEMKDPARELERKRIEARLVAKNRL